MTAVTCVTPFAVVFDVDVVVVVVFSSLLASTASELRLFVRTCICVFLGDVGFLLSVMLLELLLVVISDPFCSEMRFSLDAFRFSGSLMLPLDGLCSILFIVDDLDGPGGVAGSVP